MSGPIAAQINIGVSGVEVGALGVGVSSISVGTSSVTVLNQTGVGAVSASPSSPNFAQVPERLSSTNWNWEEDNSTAVGRKARFLPSRFESTIRAKTLISDALILGDAGTGKVDLMKAIANLQFVCGALYNEILILKNGGSGNAPVNVGN